jgi:uncharacterized protein (DUF983 family)
MLEAIKIIWNYKCPRCRVGDIFVKPFNLTDPLNMPEACPECGQKTEPELGFYYGAMFLSYMIGIWFLIIPALILVLYFKWSAGAATAVAVLIEVLIYLRLLRVARSVWLYMNVKYDPELSEKIKQEKGQSQVSNGKEWKARV